MATKHLIGRKRELQGLQRKLARGHPSVVIVLGRRRVGKTRLLLEATRERPTIFYQATRIAGSMSLNLFKAEAERVVGSHPLFDGVADWLGALTYLKQVAAERIGGLTVVLDEFPYMCDADPALPSVIQKFCDSLREDGTSMNLVLCGSKISFMEELLGEKNPLHGRQTFQLDVGPLPFRDAARFFPDWTPEERLRAYGVFGGIPYYLTLCDPTTSLETNVRELVLAMGAPLSDEPSNLLQAELRDVTRYATILRGIADGCTDSGQIVGRVREIRDASALAPYVRKLEELRLIRIVRSLDASERERNRRYYLDDPFLAFWYRFYLPNASALAAGHADQVWDHAIAPHLDDYMGLLFEWICRDYIRLFGPELLPSAAREVGGVWGEDFDIDVAGLLLDGTPFSGECKWWRDPVGLSVLERLREVTTRTTYYAGREDRVIHLLFSRSGFSHELELRRDDPHLRLVGPRELLGIWDPE